MPRTTRKTRATFATGAAINDFSSLDVSRRHIGTMLDVSSVALDMFNIALGHVQRRQLAQSGSQTVFMW